MKRQHVENGEREQVFDEPPAIPLIALSSPTPKLHRLYTQLHTRKETQYIRGENGTYTTMLDTGIAVCSISCVQFIAGQGSTRWSRVLMNASTSCQSNQFLGGPRQDPARMSEKECV